jgi:hypothetical protein
MLGSLCTEIAKNWGCPLFAHCNIIHCKGSEAGEWRLSAEQRCQWFIPKHRELKTKSRQTSSKQSQSRSLECLHHSISAEGIEVTGKARKNHSWAHKGMETRNLKHANYGGDMAQELIQEASGGCRCWWDRCQNLMMKLILFMQIASNSHPSVRSVCH